MFERRPGCAGAIVIAGILTFSNAARATDEGETTDLVAQHLSAREDVLSRQHQSAATLARQHAWLAYRLSRQRSLGFFANVGRRRDDARAADQAVRVMRRSLDESRKIAHELELVRGEQKRLHATTEDRVARRQAQDTLPAPARFAWPVHGTVVVARGVRTDEMTDVELRETGLQILARVDSPVEAPAAGRVHRVERLVEGGYAVVVAHGGGYATIVSGLREVRVAPGNEVEEGRVLGLVGRTLDAAPVVRLSIWKGGEALDPNAILRR